MRISEGKMLTTRCKEMATQKKEREMLILEWHQSRERAKARVIAKQRRQELAKKTITRIVMKATARQVKMISSQMAKVTRQSSSWPCQPQPFSKGKDTPVVVTLIALPVPCLQ